MDFLHDEYTHRKIIWNSYKKYSSKIQGEVIIIKSI